MTEDDIISRAEAADLLGVHPRTLDRWVRSGAVPYVTVGPAKIRHYRRSDMQKLIRVVDVPAKKNR